MRKNWQQSLIWIIGIAVAIAVVIAIWQMTKIKNITGTQGKMIGKSRRDEEDEEDEDLEPYALDRNDAVDLEAGRMIASAAEEAA